MVANHLHSPPHPTKQSRSIVRRLYNSSIPEIAVILLAGIVRFWRLGYHSFWFDEAVSLSWAGSDPGYTWRVTFALIQDKHPPVYYIALHYWQQLLEFVGLAHSDVALRAFGALLGVLTVWGTMLLARRLSGRPTGLAAALFVALAPVLVWYSQELRMFQPATTAIVWTAYCLARAWNSSSWRGRTVWWVGFVICIELALYTYLFSAFILPTAGLTLLALALLGREWRPLADLVASCAAGTAALILAGLVFAPLALNAWSVSGSESTPGHAFERVITNLRKLLQIFTVWRVDWPDAWLSIVLFLMSILVLLGVFLPIRRWGQLSARFHPYVDQVWLAIWIGTPILIANILLGRSRSIFVEDRYLLFIAPFVLWAVARGVVALGERYTIAGVIAGLTIVICFGSALPAMWQPARLREDWRAASSYIAAYQQTSHGLPSAVVAHVDYTRTALEWYLRQQATFDEIPIFFPFGGTLHGDEVDTVIAPPLRGIEVDLGATTLWLTQSHLAGVDDQGLVESWLNQSFPVITEQYPTGVKLSGYSLRSQFEKLPTLAENAAFPDVELAPGLHLVACEIVTPRVAARDTTMHPPSGWVHVRTWWQLSEPLEQDYFSTAQVIGPEGVWGDRLTRQNELMRRSPTSTWSVGDYMREEQDINLNPITPPGVYPVQISVTSSADENEGPTASCGTVIVY